MNQQPKMTENVTAVLQSNGTLEIYRDTVEGDRSLVRRIVPSRASSGNLPTIIEVEKPQDDQSGAWMPINNVR